MIVVIGAVALRGEAPDGLAARAALAAAASGSAVELITNSYMNAESIRVDGGVRMQPK